MTVITTAEKAAASSSPVAVIGGGGHCRVVMSAIRAAEPGVEIRIYDDNREKEGSVVDGAIVYHTSGLVAGMRAIVAIGTNKTRKRLVERFSELKLEWTTFVHPFAVVDKLSTLGKGTVVMAGAVIQPGAEIGDHAIINTRCSVDHDCRVAVRLSIAFLLLSHSCSSSSPFSCNSIELLSCLSWCDALWRNRSGGRSMGGGWCCDSSIPQTRR